MFNDPARLGRHDLHGDTDAHGAVRFGLAAAGAGAALLIAAAAWISTCAGATAGGAACGTPQLALLAMAAPGVLVVAGIWASARAYQSWKRNEDWRAWQRAALTLMMLTLLAVTLALPMLARA